MQIRNMNFFRRTSSGASPAELKELMTLFLDGATTPGQEERLYAYFGGPAPAGADPELERYRPMMACYAALPGRRVEASRRRRRRRSAIAVAASVVLLMAVGAVVALRAPSPADGVMELYAGSYIVRQGQRITDLRTIYPELRRAECLSDSLIAAAESDGTRAESIEQALIEQIVCRIADPELAAELRADLL